MARKKLTKEQKAQRNDEKFSQVADALVKLMEAGTTPWKKGWVVKSYRNAKSGHVYTGLNPTLADISVVSRGYTSSLFLGFNEAKKLRLKIIKGSKATYLRVGGSTIVEETNAESGTTTEKLIRFGKWIPIFNLDCFEDGENAEVTIAELKARYHVEPNTQPRIEDAEKLVSAQKAQIASGGSRAYYAPVQDKIQMPAYDSFRSPEAYYATVIHELSHWTGHKSRLGRKLSGKNNKAEYAFEELVAEMSAAMVCSILGLDHNLENHASYLSSWIKCISNDNRAFFRAYGQAKDAANLLLENADMATELDE